MPSFGRRAMSVAAAVVALASQRAFAQISGPIYPAPGGTVFSSIGSANSASGREGTYSGFDNSQFGSLYWTFLSVANPYAVGNGSGGPTGDMKFFGLQSIGGVITAVWQSTANIMVKTSNATYSSPVFLSVQVKAANSSDALGAGALAGNPWIFMPQITDPVFNNELPVFDATNYAATGFDIWSQYTVGAWAGTGATPLADWYNNLPSKDASGSLHTASDGEFFSTAAVTSTPEPASIALLGTGLVGLGGFARSRRKRATTV